jgi:hypothetical protein
MLFRLFRLAQADRCRIQNREGKRRSRKNATKHGIFSRCLILDGESRADFDRMLDDSVIHLQPQGPIEEYLVEQLAIQIWRRIRVLRAETSLISRSPSFMGSRSESDLPNSYSLIASRGSDPIKTRVNLLENAAQQMGELLLAVEARGFDFDQDALVIRNVYGWLQTHHLNEPNASIPLLGLLSTTQENPPERPLFSENCLIEVIDLIQSEWDRFKYLAIEEKKKESTFASHSALILGETDLDRILRYESHISREFDRTLNQLERLQSARRSPTRG